MIRGLVSLIQDFGKNMGKQNISAFAASTAFFFFLSMVPMLIMISTVLPYTPLTADNLLTAMNGIVPEKIMPLAQELVRDVYERSEGLLSIAIIVMIWTAGKGMLALMRGLNAVSNVEETRNYLWVRFVACFYTLIMLLMVVISLFVMVFGNRLVDMLLYHMPQLQPLVALLLHFRFLVVWIVLMLLFAAIYAYVPNGRLCFREQIPGAAFTAIAWNGFSWGFSLYVDWTDYSIYGSLSIIILVMLWMYFCMYIVMVGAYLNCYFQPLNRVVLGKNKEGRKEKKNLGENERKTEKSLKNKEKTVRG